jgi:hypothetical protein
VSETPIDELSVLAAMFMLRGIDEMLEEMSPYHPPCRRRCPYPPRKHSNPNRRKARHVYYQEEEFDDFDFV